MDARITLMPPMRLSLGRLSSPIGTLLLVSDAEGALRALDFDDHEARMHRLLRLHYHNYSLVQVDTPTAVASALAGYFAGDLRAIEQLCVATGGTAFQRGLWSTLREIPAGTTTTYGAVAARLDRPTASRAVGAANGANPVAIVVPCHRVVGANGDLTGYGGGIERKRWLLEHERTSSAAHTQTRGKIA